MTIVLHGAGGNARSAVKLGLPAFLAQAVTQSGVPPSVLVSVDGGYSSYWHRRAGGDDPLAMIVYEVLPRLAARGHRVGKVGIFGWSMGGYGALLLAQRLGAATTGPGVAAVVASSPALFATYQSAREANRQAFDSPADFAANDVTRGLATLRRLPVLVDCGEDDPFAAQDSLLRANLGDPPGGMAPGCHDSAFWHRRLPAQLAFLGAHLPAQGTP